MMYIAVKEKYAKYLPHSAGRYAAKRFRKAQCPIVERLTNSMMMHGRNNGKKLMTVRIVKHAFEIIHLLTGEVRLPLIHAKLHGTHARFISYDTAVLFGRKLGMDGRLTGPLSGRTLCRSW